MNHRLMYYIICLVMFIIGEACAGMNASALVMHCHECHGLLVDYRGNRVGYDAATKKVYQEIRYGRYTFENYNEDYPYYYIDVGNPDEGLYQFIIVSTYTQPYSVGIGAYDQLGNDVRTTIFGILSRGEEQRVEILYSPHTYDTTTIRKIMDAVILEKELKSALKHKMISGGQSGKKLRKFMSQAAKAIKQDKSEIAVANIQQFIEILEQEKVKLHKEGIQEPPFAMPDDFATDEQLAKRAEWIRYMEWKDKYISPVDILISDAKLVLENMQITK